VCWSGFNPGGIEGCSAVLADWNGGIADTKRNRLVFWGGGHNGYGGNEVYALDLNTLQMLRLDSPSPSNTSCAETYRDGTPNARHTYGGLAYIPTMDKMFVHGAGSYPCGTVSTSYIPTWLLDFPTLISNGPNATGAGPPKAWIQMDPTNGLVVTTDCCDYQSFAAYDPTTDAIYFTDASANFWRYNPHINTMTHLDRKYGFGGSYVHMNSEVDYGHHAYFAFGSSQAWKSDLTQTTPTMTEIDGSITGCSALVNADYPGLAYDPVQNKIIGWIGGPKVIVFDPAKSNCTTQIYNTGPGSPQTNGTLGRFRYFPALGVFALVNDFSQNAWVLRMTPAIGSGPIISAVSAGSITSTGATITWTTDAASSSQVEYGTTSSYVNTTSLDSTLVTSHSQTLRGLSANTTYHYAVISTDSGGTTTSADNTFTTTDAPIISSVTATSITQTGATITWTTNVPANSQVEYGTTSSYGSTTTLDTNLVTSHSEAITGLSPNTTYHYAVMSMAFNLQTTSSDYTFQTSGGAVPFATRCASPGIVKCISFDSDSDMQTGSYEDPQASILGGPQTMFPDCGGTFRFARDTVVFAEGVSSLRFDIPGNVTCANEAGQYSNWMGGYWAPSPLSGTTPVDAPLIFEGTDLYVQFKARVDSGWLANTSGNGRKLVVMEGIDPVCGTMTFVQENTYFRGFMDSYTDCGQTGMYTPAGASSNIHMEQGDFPNCIYGSTYAANCLMYVASQWMTFYYHIGLAGGWSSSSCYWTGGCTGAAVMEAWAAVDPNPLKKWLDIPNFTFKCHSSPNPCGTGPYDAMSRLTFEVYDTGNHTANNVPGTVWYDSVIISSQPIPAPYGLTP